MKHFSLIIFLLAGFIPCSKVLAVNVENTTTPHSGIGLESMTINDFISLDFAEYRTEDGKKLKWIHRLGFKMTQKSYERGVRKGKLDGDANFYNTAKAASPANRTGRLSLIFASVGLVLLFLSVPVLGIIGLGLSVAGLVFGLSGLRKDEDQTMAILGTAISALALVLFLILVISAAAWLSRLF